MSTQDFDLARLESWMLAVVSHPEGLRSGVDAARSIMDVDNESIQQVVLPSKELCAHDRLEVYSDMYFSRLIESLIEDFGAIHRALGEERFEEIATAYLVENPSRNFRLNPLSAGFSKFLSKLKEDEFLVQLAQLERSLVEVFDDKNDEALSKADIQAVPTEYWGTTRFTPIRAFRLHQFDYPVNAFLNAHEERREQIEVPKKAPSHVLVWRLDYRVMHSDLSWEQHLILTGLNAGLTLGETLEQFIDEPECNPQELMANLGTWFQEWTSDGLFSAVEIVSTRP